MTKENYVDSNDRMTRIMSPNDEIFMTAYEELAMAVNYRERNSAIPTTVSDQN